MSAKVLSHDYNLLELFAVLSLVWCRNRLQDSLSGFSNLTLQNLGSYETLASALNVSWIIEGRDYVTSTKYQVECVSILFREFNLSEARILCNCKTTHRYHDLQL